MVGKHFELGDLVWAKMKGFPPWPGEIASPKDDKVRKCHHFVYFYGSENYAWIPDENIEMHNETLVEKYTKNQKRSPVYLGAVDKIGLKAKDNLKYLKDFQLAYDNVVSPSSKETTSSISPKKKKSPKIQPSKSHYSSLGHKPISPKKSKLSRNANNSAPYHFTPRNFTFTHNRLGPSEDIDSGFGMLSRHVYKDRPKTPSVDMVIKNPLLKNKDVVPTKKKIGFLGLGRIGQGIVKNLLQTNHSVTIWNRTTSKCDKFVNVNRDESSEFAGAEQVLTPQDVIMNCDITFCCVSDAKASNTLVFGNCGVLSGLQSVLNSLQCPSACTEKKGFVEMTTLDPVTSHTISQEIEMKGGRFLKVSLSGTRSDAVKGLLHIIASGDRSLYDDCHSCFMAMADNYVFLSDEVRVASTFSIVHNSLMGTVYASLAESLALIERVGLSTTDFMDVLDHGNLKMPTFVDKGRVMIDNKYMSDMPLKHVQKNINFAMALSHKAEQPMQVLSSTNEMYKHCMLLRYADHDVGAIFEGTKR